MTALHRYNRTYLDFLDGSAVPVLDALRAKSPAERERKIIEYIPAYPITPVPITNYQLPITLVWDILFNRTTIPLSTTPNIDRC